MNLEQWDQRGWVIGPSESKEGLSSRVAALERFFSFPPETVDHFLTDRDWEPACERIENLYQCRPDWIVAHYDNAKLPFFQGAATWIVEKKGVRIPLIQLKERLETGALMKLYRRDEVLAHEAVHAIRMQFDEPRFEEIFAYRTSHSWWRRFFGPLFERPWESYLFLALLFLPVVFEMLAIAGISIGHWGYLRFAPLAFFSWLLLRLIFLQGLLHLAIKKLTRGLRDPKSKWAVALRLTDREIFQFAFSPADELKEKIAEEKSPRWTLLKQMFFKKIHDWV